MQALLDAVSGWKRPDGSPIDITPDMADKFAVYADMLEERNHVMNLTAVTGAAIAARHFADSLKVLTVLDFGGKSVIDVGSGAGFPGLPIRIACPSVRLRLLDSTGKRVAFTREAADRLGLSDVDCVTARAEEYVKNPGQRESYDAAVSRAVADLPMLCELCLPYVRIGGYFAAFKGSRAKEELARSSGAIRELGGELAQVLAYRLPGSDAGMNLVLIRKIGPTPPAYPRRFAKIQAEPL